MLINETGKRLDTEGLMTAPQNTNYWFGNDEERVAFDFCVLDDDTIVIHALYGDSVNGTHKDFFYGFASPSVAVGEVSRLIQEAKAFLKARGALKRDHGFELICDLSRETAKLLKLKAMLH